MAINIKNSDAQDLARKLSKATGESLTTAITEALRERLERVLIGQGQGLADRLMRIGKDCAGQLGETSRNVDHGDLLYDEKGLPR